MRWSPRCRGCSGRGRPSRRLLGHGWRRMGDRRRHRHGGGGGRAAAAVGARRSARRGLWRARRPVRRDRAGVADPGRGEPERSRRPGVDVGALPGRAGADVGRGDRCLRRCGGGRGDRDPGPGRCSRPAASTAEVEAFVAAHDGDRGDLLDRILAEIEQMPTKTPARGVGEVGAGSRPGICLRVLSGPGGGRPAAPAVRRGRGSGPGSSAIRRGTGSGMGRHCVVGDWAGSGSGSGRNPGKG